MHEVGAGPSRPGWIFILAPIVFVCHFLEEAPGFVSWFNAHVSRGISQPLFRTVNLVALTITTIVVVGEWVGRSRFTAAVMVAWLSFLMLTNALFHIAAALSDRAYVPGLVTAIVLYLPFYGLVVNRIVRTRSLAPAGVAVAAFIGAIPMAVHGYLIVFRGSRLF